METPQSINGSILQYYFFCMRRCYLHANQIKTEHTSELVKLGKYYHKEFEDTKEEEKLINGVKIDKIEGDYLIEYKKSNSSIDSSRWQLLFYLFKLKQVGIYKKGKLKFKDNRKNEEICLTSEKEEILKKVIKDIQDLLKAQSIPPVLRKKKCKKCSYFEFCYT